MVMPSNINAINHATGYLAVGGLELAAHVTCEATRIDKKYKPPDPNIPNGTQSKGSNSKVDFIYKHNLVKRIFNFELRKAS